LYAGSKFRGTCRNCGKIGQKANDCRSGGNRPQGNNNQANSRPAVASNPATGAPNPNALTNNNQGGGQRPRFNGTCTYYNKVGHRDSQCFSKMRDQSDAATTALASGSTPTPTSSTNQADSFGLTVIESCQAVAFLASSYANKDLLIADTGASCHMACNDTGMFNCIDIHEDIKVGDGNQIKAIKMGSKRV
jgi:hypothetical protein